MAQFMAAPWLRKHLKIYNLRTTYATKMKLGRSIYLHETFHLTEHLGATFRAWQDVAKKPPKKYEKLGFWA